jgi:hypothetical protein
MSSGQWVWVLGANATSNCDSSRSDTLDHQPRAIRRTIPGRFHDEAHLLGVSMVSAGSAEPSKYQQKDPWGSLAKGALTRRRSYESCLSQSSTHLAQSGRLRRPRVRPRCRRRHQRQHDTLRDHLQGTGNEAIAAGQDGTAHYVSADWPLVMFK